MNGDLEMLCEAITAEAEVLSERLYGIITSQKPTSLSYAASLAALAHMVAFVIHSMEEEGFEQAREYFADRLTISTNDASKQ